MKTNHPGNLSAEDFHDESFRDHLATVDKKGKRKWVFAQKPKGKFYSVRTLLSLGFFLLFFALPFVKWHERPLFMFNIPDAKFIIFGKIFWPQDFFIFGVTMITFIIFIVLFTAAFGRLFCGWVCPQTNFMEMLFRKVEYLIEGDATAQRLLSKSAWTSRKIRIKLTKHLAFYLLAFIIANFFLAYIISMDELKKIISEPVSEHVAGFSAILVFSGVFYGVYAYFREQVCTVICPYGRLQSVLLDRNSMLVAYDYKRGETRGKYTKDKERLSTQGDCIDCYQCVKVCPTGIDIRNGTQMECVGCTACIDACDRMMDAVGRPRGLVRYASENGIANKEKLHYTGRMKFYTVVLTILASLLTFLLVTRTDVGGAIVRVATNPPFQLRGTDSISNLYTIKVVNKTIHEIDLHLKLENAPGQIIEAEGQPIQVGKEAQGRGSFFVILPRKYISNRSTKLVVGLYDDKNKKIAEMTTNFMGPFSRF